MQKYSTHVDDCTSCSSFWSLFKLTASGTRISIPLLGFKSTGIQEPFNSKVKSLVSTEGSMGCLLERLYLGGLAWQPLKQPSGTISESRIKLTSLYQSSIPVFQYAHSKSNFSTSVSPDTTSLVNSFTLSASNPKLRRTMAMNSDDARNRETSRGQNPLGTYVMK